MIFLWFSKVEESLRYKIGLWIERKELPYVTKIYVFIDKNVLVWKRDQEFGTVIAEMTILIALKPNSGYTDFQKVHRIHFNFESYASSNIEVHFEWLWNSVEQSVWSQEAELLKQVRKNTGEAFASFTSGGV